jgi:hypothetical protein
MLWTVLIAGCGPTEEASCEEAIPGVFATEDNYCAPIWACCVGDPSEDPRCWYQSADPEVTDEADLVWQCDGSFADCEDAEVQAAEWSCFLAPEPG